MILILVVQTRDLQSGGIHGIYNNLHFDTSGKEKFENTQNHYLENTFGFKDKIGLFQTFLPKSVRSKVNGSNG